MFEIVKTMNIVDLIDIIAASFLIYILFLWFRRTKAVFVFTGIAISGGVYLIIKFLKFRLVATLMQGFFAVILVAIVIIFQEEIRRLFEQLAFWGLSPKFRKRKIFHDSQKYHNMLANKVFSFAGAKTGAIIVLKGKDTIIRHIRSGIKLNGILSEPLLESIFDIHSNGHDGAVLIEDNKVTHFACHLPLSENSVLVKGKGTRHCAALGLSELSDVLCIVVSEENGSISLARFGKMNTIESREKLFQSLEDFWAEINPAPATKGLRLSFMRNIKVKLAVFMLSVFLWWFFIHESIVIYKTFDVPVKYINLSSAFEIKETIPSEVKVVLSASRRDSYFVDKQDIRAIIKLIDIENFKARGDGYYSITLTASDIALPPSQTIINILPRDIRVRIEKNK